MKAAVFHEVGKLISMLSDFNSEYSFLERAIARISFDKGL